MLAQVPGEQTTSTIGLTSSGAGRTLSLRAKENERKDCMC